MLNNILKLILNMGHKWDTDWACIDGTYMGQGERKMNGT